MDHIYGALTVFFFFFLLLSSLTILVLIHFNYIEKCNHYMLQNPCVAQKEKVIQYWREMEGSKFSFFFMVN